MQDDCETVKKIFTVIIGDSYNASQWLPVFKKEKKTYTENTNESPYEAKLRTDILLYLPDSFLWTDSFGQFDSMNWFNSLVCLHNHAMT